MKRVIGVAGFKNSGKTTLVEKLVVHLTAKGYRVSTVKHAHHSFDIDHEGRDSFRHRKAGASEVAVISKERTAIIHELRGAEPPSLSEVIDKLQDCDLVIVEGYKRDTHDKIEVRNLSLNHQNLAGDDSTIVAIASTGPIPDAPVQVFDRDDVAALAKFIVDHCSLNRNWKIRRGGALDAEAIRNLTRQVYAKWIPSIGREPFPMTADFNAAVLNHWIDLLEENGKLLGLVETIPYADHLFVENLAVAENNQGSGLGTTLLRHVEDLARAARLPDVQLSTNKAFATNVAFYQKRGYELYASKPLPDGSTMVRFRKRVS
jgi:molybdopterin-guanine dinucleotide biosynthesis adapter protein